LSKRNLIEASEARLTQASQNNEPVHAVKTKATVAICSSRSAQNHCKSARSAGKPISDKKLPATHPDPNNPTVEKPTRKSGGATGWRHQWWGYGLIFANIKNDGATRWRRQSWGHGGGTTVSRVCINKF